MGSIPVNRFLSIVWNRLTWLTWVWILSERRRCARSLVLTISVLKAVELSSSLLLFADEGVGAQAREKHKKAKFRRSTVNG